MTNAYKFEISSDDDIPTITQIQNLPIVEINVDDLFEIDDTDINDNLQTTSDIFGDDVCNAFTIYSDNDDEILYFVKK